MDFRDQISGWREAVQQEQLTRDAAFLGLTETIGQFEVVPLTLRHLLILRISHSPFLCGGVPQSAHDIVRFLWLLHPQYDPRGGKAREMLKRACAVYTVPSKPWLHTRRAMERYERRCAEVMIKITEITSKIRAYLAEALIDWPAGSAGSIVTPFSDACAISAMMAREHHRTEEWVFNCPLKALFQYINEIREARGKPMFNPSDKLVNDYMRKNQDSDSLLGKMMAEARNP